MFSSLLIQWVIKQTVEGKKAFTFLKDGVFISKQRKMGTESYILTSAVTAVLQLWYVYPSSYVGFTDV